MTWQGGLRAGAVVYFFLSNLAASPLHSTFAVSPNGAHSDTRLGVSGWAGGLVGGGAPGRAAGRSCSLACSLGRSLRHRHWRCRWCCAAATARAAAAPAPQVSAAVRPQAHVFPHPGLPRFATICMAICMAAKGKPRYVLNPLEQAVELCRQPQEPCFQALLSVQQQHRSIHI